MHPQVLNALLQGFNRPPATGAPITGAPPVAGTPPVAQPGQQATGLNQAMNNVPAIVQTLLRALLQGQRGAGLPTPGAQVGQPGALPPMPPVPNAAPNVPQAQGQQGTMQGPAGIMAPFMSSFVNPGNTMTDLSGQ